MVWSDVSGNDKVYRDPEWFLWWQAMQVQSLTLNYLTPFKHHYFQTLPTDKITECKIQLTWLSKINFTARAQIILA